MPFASWPTFLCYYAATMEAVIVMCCEDVEVLWGSLKQQYVPSLLRLLYDLWAAVLPLTAAIHASLHQYV